MQIEDSSWSYNEFLAFLMVYGAQVSTPLTEEELEFIKARTGISDIEKIKVKVNSVSDAEAIDVIEDYRKKYLYTKEKEEKVRQDLEELLHTENKHTQLQNVVIHILERLISVKK